MRIRHLRATILTAIILIFSGNALLAQGSLTNIGVNLNDNTAGAEVIYTFTFTTSATGNGSISGIPDNGKIEFVFPAGFEVSGVDLAQSKNMNMNGGFSGISINGQAVILTRDGSGTDVPALTEVSIAIGMVVNHSSVGNYDVEIITMANSGTQIDIGSTPNFSIVAGPLQHFHVSTSGNATAGSNFSTTITAKDAFDNTVSSFTNISTLTDKSGAMTPTVTGSFNSGIWIGNLVFTKSFSNNQITVTYDNKSGVSALFNVMPASLDRFAFDSITGPKTAGTPFSIRITALDQYSNTVTGFTNQVSLTDYSGSLNVTSNNFVSGILNQNVTITKSQADNYITANHAGSGKSGASNLFNMNPGTLSKFSINPISSPQAAGDWFSIKVIAQDNYNNTITSFNATADLSDLSNSITPNQSSNFSNGQWTGSVKIGLPYTNDAITVRRTGGSEQGTSNNFNVNVGSLDHFMISNITTKTAGVAFSISITAQDKENNTIPSFTGPVTISDQTGSMTPTSSGSFSNGTWTGNVTITASSIENQIFVTSSGKTGASNDFQVNTNSLHHFSFANISSPKIAGQSFSISIEARDQYENKITSFASSVSLSDRSNTLSPTSTANFTSGAWSGSVTITKKYSDNQITASGSGKSGQSNTFNMNPGAIHHIVVRDNPGGLGNAVADLILNLDDQTSLFAAGYDQWNNYIREVQANWGRVGTLDLPSPNHGSSTAFKPVTPATSGKIYADSLSVGADSTGTITVGSIHHVLIRDAANGAGNVVNTVTMTSDDTLRLYAAAYDEGNNYLGPAMVDWSNSGNLQPTILFSNMAAITFSPTTAPKSGRIIAAHGTAIDDTTGNIAVNQGAANGKIVLHPNPKIIPARPDSFSIITSEIIKDSDGNPIAGGDLFTISTSIGKINSPVDQSPSIVGHQVKSSSSGQINFTIKADSLGGMALIRANSVGKGTASGDTTLLISSIEIVAITSESKFVSQGQSNVPVRMTVRNRGVVNFKISNDGAGLTFYDTNKLNHSGDYVVSRQDTFTVIPSQGGQRILSFHVAVHSNATTDLMTIDGYLGGLINGKSVSDTSANQKHRWLVQTPPVLLIERVQASVDTIIQGANTSVTMTIRNDGDVSLVIDSDSLTFWAGAQAPVQVTREYKQVPFPSNPDTIKGHTSQTFSYTVQVGAIATPDTIILNGKAIGRDVNTNVSYSDFNADFLDGWKVKQASYLNISKFIPSQTTVTSNQEGDWFLNMVFANSGVKLKLDSAAVLFKIGVSDISNQYQVSYPDTFLGSKNDTLYDNSNDTLKIAVTKTGKTLGTITIEGIAYLTDMISGQVIKNSVTGVVVQSPAQLKIESVRTSQPEVTISQAAPWEIIVALTNSGGSDVKIDSTQLINFISFAGDTNFSVTAPAGFHHNGGFRLDTSETDSLFFTVDTTGNIPGNRQINARITAREINSSRMISVEKSAIIKIEQPANIRIAQTKNMAPNAPFVDTNQMFQIAVVVANSGQDGARDIAVSLKSDSSSSILTPIKTLDFVPGGQSDTLMFDVRAHSNWIISEIFRTHIDTAFAENTTEADKILIGIAADSWDTTTVQRPARMKIVSVTPSQDTVRALSRDEWQIVVAVVDSGAGFIRLNQPSANDISVFVDGVAQSDYTIIPPTELKNSKNLILSWWRSDTLIYRVTNTGIMGGIGRIKVNLSGQYLNTKTAFGVKDSTAIFIRPSADVYIDITEPVCPNINQYGIGQVNTDQQFSVRSKIRNAGGEQVDNIVVSLDAPGYTIKPDTIDQVLPLGNAWAQFNVRAQRLPVDRINFIAAIKSAISHESGLPAAIGAASDSIAALKIHKPAVLKLSLNQADTIFTSGQLAPVRVVVENLGTAEVDSSGELYIKMPYRYSVMVNDQPRSDDTTRFKVGQQISWQVRPPESMSSGDEIIAAISRPPLDKNTNLFALIENTNPYDTLIVKTIPSMITIQSAKIIAPTGAMDDTLSTFQDFWVQVGVSYSENITNVRAALTLPEGFGFGIGVDSLQSISNNKATWKLKASTSPHAMKKWIKVKSFGVAGEHAVQAKDSIGVVTRSQAHISIDRAMISWPPEAKDDSTLSIGQEFDLSVTVINSGQAKAVGPAFLKLYFGSTGITTTQDSLKAFVFNTPVTWRLKAPVREAAWAPIIVTLDSIPLDENTNEQAYAPVLFKNFYVETQQSALAAIDSLWIKSPSGALDGILSTLQSFQIEADVSWQNCRNNNVSIALQLSGGFTTAESNPKNLSNSEGQGKVSWSIKAPELPIQNQPIWLRLTAYDANSGELFVVRSETLFVDVVNHAEVKLNAKIISPAGAEDGIVSIGQEFVVAAYLSNVGGANLTGNFSATLTLPEGQGYSTPQVTTLTGAFDDTLFWTIQAPLYEREAKTLQVQLVRSYPKDENTSVEVVAEAVLLRTVSFPIQTEEKSVTISDFSPRNKNTIARGDTSIAMLGLELICSGNANSNNVLFSGVKIKLKDRFNNLIIDPSRVLSRISAVKYRESSMVYGKVTVIPSTNPIEIQLSPIDTLKPEIPNKIEFLVDVLSNTSITDFRLVIDSTEALDLVDEASGQIPKLKNSSGQNYQVLNFESEPSVIIKADFKEDFRNFPNPFGVPDRPVTYFIYYLDQDTDVKLQIYTLIGELVWSCSHAATEPQGKKGSHEADIFWDGRNEQGHRVLNGVYIARISTGYGKNTITKIAVIK